MNIDGQIREVESGGKISMKGNIILGFKVLAEESAQGSIISRTARRTDGRTDKQRIVPKLV
jgi:hypothetical protein